MSIQVETKDCTSISDAELAEMADLCAEREPRFDIGFLSKQREEWVLVTRAREGSKLRGLLLLHPRADRGHPVAPHRAGHRGPDLPGRHRAAGHDGRQVPPGPAGLPGRGRPGRHPAAGRRGIPGLRRADRRRARARPEGHRRGAGLGTPPGQALRGRRPHRRPDLRGDGRRLRVRRIRLRQPQVRGRPRTCAFFDRGRRPGRGPPGRLRVGHGRGPGRRQTRAAADARVRPPGPCGRAHHRSAVLGTHRSSGRPGNSMGL